MIEGEVVGRTPFASSADARFDVFAATLTALRGGSDAEPSAPHDLLGRTEFAAAVAEVDAWDRLVSMGVAMRREAIARAHEQAADHLVRPEGSDPNATEPHEAHEARVVPGAPRLHRSASGEVVDVGDRYLDRQRLTAAAIGPMLRLSKGRAQSEVWSAITIAQVTPNLHERTLCGDYTDLHARVFLDELNHLPEEVMHDADAAIAATAGRLGVRELKKRIACYLANRNLPASGAEAAETEGHASRCVSVSQPDLWGMADLRAHIPATDAIAIDRLLSDLAATAPEDDQRTLAQRRADALVTCFSGPAALSPAIAEHLGFEPACIDDPRFCAVSVDARQEHEARNAWEVVRMLGASLGLTFSPGLNTVVNVHMPVSTYTDLIASTAPDRVRPPDHARSPDRARPPDAGAELCPESEHSDDAEAGGCAGPRQSAFPRSIYSINLEGDQVWGIGALPNPTGDVCRPGAAMQSPRIDRERARHPASFAPYIDGIGPVSTSYLRAIFNHATCRRILTDPETGAPRDIGKAIHDPTIAMRRRVRLRDGVCRFPGCTTRATASTEIDHVTEHRADGTGGATADANLEVLCSLHHQVKHQTPWTPVLHDDGTITWRNDLLNLTITTHPDSDTRDR